VHGLQGVGGRGVLRRGEAIGGHGTERVLQVVDASDQVFCEFLEGKVPRGLDLAFCAVLQVAEVCDGAEVFVL